MDLGRRGVSGTGEMTQGLKGPGMSLRDGVGTSLPSGLDLSLQIAEGSWPWLTSAPHITSGALALSTGRHGPIFQLWQWLSRGFRGVVGAWGAHRAGGLLENLALSWLECLG